MTTTTTATATQTEHPWRATARTVFAALVGLAAAWALIIEAIGLDAGIPWVATSLAIAGAVTRVLALPAVTDWLERFVPWLAPAPREPERLDPAAAPDPDTLPDEPDVDEPADE